MNRKISKKVGIVLMTISVVMILVFALLFTLVIRKIDFGSNTSIIRIVIIISSSVVLFIPFFIGVLLFMRCNDNANIKKTGRKSVAEVYNILTVKSGCELIVYFRGDSGIDYTYSCYITYSDAVKLTPGTCIECYVEGDECYIDTSNIVIIKK